MLVTLKEVLSHARTNQYAVPAFDCTEDVMVRTILETAEEADAPVVLMCLEMDLTSGDGNGWLYLSGLIRAVAPHHKIPVVLHLDHATDLAQVETALDLGFTSVMIDGSMLPFEENVRLTRAAVDRAESYGASVEAELGYVGGMDLEDRNCTESILTEPDDVVRFVEATEIDALAVSIGTAHGVYRAEPDLNIERLKELDAAGGVPLVLHGGSGTPDDQVREAVRHGICKVNIFADERIAMGRGLAREAESMARPDPLPSELFGPIREALGDVIAEKIDLLGAGNRARQVEVTL